MPYMNRAQKEAQAMLDRSGGNALSKRRTSQVLRWRNEACPHCKGQGCSSCHAKGWEEKINYGK